MRHHAFVIEAEIEDGIEVAKRWQEQELRMQTHNNPDSIELRYGLLSVEDARAVQEIAMQAPLRGKEKVLIIAATRAYHEAQNALLKLFEEPPEGTYIFLVLPSLGGLLPTLRSRVQELKHEARSSKSETNNKSQISKTAEEFLKANGEKRSAIIKRLASGRDAEHKRVLRDEAIAIVCGIEAAAHEKLLRSNAPPELASLLSDIATLRGYLYDRSAPVKMILEHVSLVIPNNLG